MADFALGKRIFRGLGEVYLSMQTLTAAAGPDQGRLTSQLLLRSRHDGGLTVLQLAGELDIYTVVRFSRGLHRAVHRSDRVVIDLTEVTFVDSAGVRGLTSAANRFAQQAVRLGLVCPAGPTLQALRACHLLTAFCIGQTVEDTYVAMEAWDQPVR